MELIFEKLYSFAGLGVLFFLFLQLYILFFSKNIANKSSTILSTGILGTFIGIASGLLFFDPSDIDSSIPPLLQGMSVSFLSSITGIAISIVAKNKEAIESNKGQDDFLITLNKNLDNAFQSHLGSSLKKFNESVDSLLKLHKTNEKAIKFLTDEFRETAKELKGVNNELNKLEAAGNIFQTSAESIEKVLQSLDSYSERTISSFKEIEQLGTNINRSIPQIRENIDFAIKPLTEDLQITLEKLYEHMKALRDDHSETNKRFADMLYETSGQFQEESVKMATKLKESSELTMQMIGDSMVSIADKIKDDHLEIIEAYRVFNSALNSSQNENMQ